MPRNENYVKQKVLAKIREKQYYVSLTRDFKKELLKKYYKRVDDSSDKLLDKKFDLDYLVSMMLLHVDELKLYKKDQDRVLEISIICGLIWDYLERME